MIPRIWRHAASTARAIGLDRTHRLPQARVCMLSHLPASKGSPLRLARRHVQTKKSKVAVYHGMSVRALAAALPQPKKVYALLKELDEDESTFDQPMSSDMMELIIDELALDAEYVAAPSTPQAVSALAEARERQRSGSLRLSRPPIITIMGHVDHGKTTLLDALRASHVVQGEAGGITQHIGAFSARVGQQTITVLDTPGHAAFSNMRERGALCTDIVVLVVAADDGVMPQTRESIKFARQAGVPVVVAINKCDKSGIDVSRPKQELISAGVELEGFGGHVQVIEISALKGKNLDALKEAILVEAELLELSADPRGMAHGVVIESSTDKFKGQLATVLLQDGSLKQGGVVVAGATYAKVKSMTNDTGKRVKKIGPAEAAEVMGWKELPEVGSLIVGVSSEAEAKKIVEAELRALEEEKTMDAQSIVQRRRKMAAAERKGRPRMSRKQARMAQRLKPVTPDIQEMPDHVEEKLPVYPVIIKADVQGTTEAITQLAATLPSREVKCKVLRSGVGAVTESDIDMAETFKADIIAFGVAPNKAIRGYAERAGVNIKEFKIIYKLIEDVEVAMLSLLPPLFEEQQVGKARVQQVFKLTGKRKAVVAGSRVQTGELRKELQFVLLRKSREIHRGALSSLMHHKDEVEQIAMNTECGLSFENWSDVQEGDEVVCIEQKEVKRTRLR